MDQNSKLYQSIKWIYERRLFLSVHVILVCLIAIAIALSLPKTYTSSATVLRPENTQLSSLLGNDFGGGLGAAASSMSGKSTDMYKLMSILHSRNLAEETIYTFDLEQRYSGQSIEDIIDQFHENTMFTIDEDNMLKISVRSKTDLFHSDKQEEQARQLAYHICQFITNKLDSTYTQLQVQNARNKRLVLEKRLNQNQRDLHKAQLELKTFAEEHSAIALPEQIQSSVNAAANIQSQLFIHKLELSALKRSFSSDNATVVRKQEMVDELSSALADFRKNGIVGDSLSILPSFEESPQLLYKYAQIQLRLQVQEELHKYLTQQFERAKLEEAQQTPTLQFIDTPRLPTRKSGPPRAVITIILTILGVLAGIAYLLITDLYWVKIKRVYSEISS